MTNKFIFKRHGVEKVYFLRDEEMFYVCALVDAMMYWNKKEGQCITAEIPHKATTIADLRKSKGYTQGGLASQLGLSRTTIAQWEAGETTPLAKNVSALADLYGVTVDDICACIKR